MEDIKRINEIIKKAKKMNKNIIRLEYQYNNIVAKQVWYSIAKEIINEEAVLMPQIKELWINLIQYVLGDEQCSIDLDKTLCLMGMTGSGKTLTMQVMNEFSKVDEIKFIRREKMIPFNYKIINARDIFDHYCQSGLNGISIYSVYSNICIDDLGAEPKEGLYFGTKLNVLADVIEKRHDKGLTTHYTTNLDEEEIRARYNDRVYSRMKEQSSFIILNDNDFRINNKK